MVEFDKDSWGKTNALQDGEFIKLPAGGYVCIVTNASVEPSQKDGKLQLILTLDIAEGEFAQMFRNSNTYAPRYFKKLFADGNKPSPYFKGLITNFINSNANYKFDGGAFNERNLIGKKIGMIFRDEQREWEGKIYTNAKAFIAVSVDKIRSGDFTVPPMKTIEKTVSKVKESAAEKSFDDEFTGKDIPDENVPF